MSGSINPVVRAVDVGFGNTKFVVMHTPNGIDCAQIPSLVPQASAGSDFSAGAIAKRNTVVVKVDGVAYEVGKDARLATDASYSRTLDPDFCRTSGYLALVRGAFYYMGVDKIDLLVLGLPVNLFETHQRELSQVMHGDHAIPDENGNERIVTVKKVQVIAQPIGGLLDYAFKKNLYREMKTQMNLLIDPGYFTLDWVVAEGVKMVSARSGACPGGMSAVLSAIAQSLSAELNAEVVDMQRIDEALRTASKPKFFGKECDLTKHIAVGQEKARQFVAQLANRVGKQGQDIDNIILVGGGAAFFKPLIAEKFRNHVITIAEGAIYSNVRGFQLAGEQYARSAAKA